MLIIREEDYTTVKAGGEGASFAVFTKEAVKEMYGAENVNCAEECITLGNPEDATTPTHILGKVTPNQSMVAQNCMQVEILSPVYWDNDDEQLKW